MGFVRLLLRGDVVLINQTPPASQRLYLHLARDAEGGRPVTRQKQNDQQIVSSNHNDSTTATGLYTLLSYFYSTGLTALLTLSLDVPFGQPTPHLI